MIVLQDGTEVAAGDELPMLSYMAEAGVATNEEGGVDGNCQTLWECWEDSDPTESGGTCGKCVVVVLDGMANLSEASSREKNTIKKKAKKKLGDKVDEAQCRLPCQARCMGPVKIQATGK